MLVSHRVSAHRCAMREEELGFEAVVSRISGREFIDMYIVQNPLALAALEEAYWGDEMAWRARVEECFEEGGKGWELCVLLVRSPLYSAKLWCGRGLVLLESAGLAPQRSFREQVALDVLEWGDCLGFLDSIPYRRGRLRVRDFAYTEQYRALKDMVHLWRYPASAEKILQECGVLEQGQAMVDLSLGHIQAVYQEWKRLQWDVRRSFDLSRSSEGEIQLLHDDGAVEITGSEHMYERVDRTMEDVLYGYLDGAIKKEQLEYVLMQGRYKDWEQQVGALCIRYYVHSFMDALRAHGIAKESDFVGVSNNEASYRKLLARVSVGTQLFALDSPGYMDGNEVFPYSEIRAKISQL